MRNAMLGWIEAADARLTCERPAVVLIMREPGVAPMLYAAPVAVLFAAPLLMLGL